MPGAGQKKVPGHWALCPVGQFYAGPCPPSLQTAQWVTEGQVSKGEATSIGKVVVLEGQLAKVRSQGRRAGDSSPAGRLSGSQSTSGPRNSQALCSPGGSSERKTYGACSHPAETAGGRQPAIWDLLLGLRGCRPVLSLLPASRASPSA